MPDGTAPRTAAEIRARLDHPVIDCDGHIIEYGPLLLDCLRNVGGPSMVDAYQKYGEQLARDSWYQSSPTERMRRRIGRPQWWATPSANTYDRATAVLPALRRARMDELGIDFAILYPSAGLGLVNLPNNELRPALCRAYNDMAATLFAPHAERMTPVAIIPMHTPQEAVAELDHAVGELGLKTVKTANFVQRTVPAAADAPPAARRAAQYFDALALDSPYDYDPVWAKCLALKVAPTAHNTTTGLGLHRSVTNFMYNHCGHFAAGAELFAKALFFGGVTRRFPGLNFAFMEGGVGWAAVLFHGLVSRWKKRNGKAVMQYDQAAIDHELFHQLMAQYGGELLADLSEFAGNVGNRPSDQALKDSERRDPAIVDEFAACAILKPEDIAALFAEPFYFGCEADDPFAGAALRGDGMPWRTPIKAMFGSDMGHWDVEDMRDVLYEAHELVDDGLMNAAEFRNFSCDNAIRLHAGMNPGFFAGTSVAEAASRVISMSDKGASASAAEREMTDGP